MDYFNQSKICFISVSGAVPGGASLLDASCTSDYISVSHYNKDLNILMIWFAEQSVFRFLLFYYLAHLVYSYKMVIYVTGGRFDRTGPLGK